MSTQLIIYYIFNTQKVKMQSQFCSICLNPNHNESSCPQLANINNPIKDKYCYFCKDPSHVKPQCEKWKEYIKNNPRKTDKLKERICHGCRKPGHDKPNCPDMLQYKLRQLRELEISYCDNCYSVAHVDNCPYVKSEPVKGEPVKDDCDKCKSTSHSTDSCLVDLREKQKYELKYRIKYEAKYKAKSLYK